MLLQPSQSCFSHATVVSKTYIKWISKNENMIVFGRRGCSLSLKTTIVVVVQSLLRANSYQFT